MKIKIYLLCFFMLFLTACTHTVNKENEKEIKDKTIKISTTTEDAISKTSNDKNHPIPSETTESEESTSCESNETEDSSNYDLKPIDSDTDIKLNFTKDSKTSSLKFTLGMSYDDVEKSLASIGEQIDKAPWDAYSNYTIIDKKELWPELNTEEDFNKHASVEVFLTNATMKYSFFFISNNNSNLLTCIHCNNPSIETNKHIKCGDNINNLIDQYGNNYYQFYTGKYILYEYKTNNGYLNFYINPQSHFLTEWEINLYSYQDYSECSKVLDRIYSDEVHSTESPLNLPQSSQIADEYKENSEDAESSSLEHSSNNETESNSSVITQEEAFNIVTDELEPVFNEGDYIIFEDSESKDGNDYYVFRYYYKSGTLAWFYVNQTDGSCYVLDCMENDLIEYHPGDTYWCH